MEKLKDDGILSFIVPNKFFTNEAGKKLRTIIARNYYLKDIIDFGATQLFDDKTISIMAYNLETVLAEKLETVISRGQANTRPRDFYDIHILYSLRGNSCDMSILKQALEQTTLKRGSIDRLKDYKEIINSISKIINLIF